MKFYSKPGEDAKFRKMVIDALNTWSAASGGKISFKITTVKCPNFRAFDRLFQTLF